MSTRFFRSRWKVRRPGRHWPPFFPTWEGLRGRTHGPGTHPQRPPRLVPAPGNPILVPDPVRRWESKAVFNPAALLLDDAVHLLYRAIGKDDRSALGHAVSATGVSFLRQEEDPVYAAREWFEGHRPPVRGVAPGAHASGGGGWGGVEDPRLTRLGEKVYLTYVAYNGFDPPRVALSSIGVEDFRRCRWDWARPVLISGPGVVNKNAVLFPRKIRGRYVMIHRIYPDILLDYLDDLDFDGRTRWLEGQHRIPPSADGWDNHKVGAGPPPLETPHGWLLITQGVGKNDGYRYKVGAMLLDRDRPERVLVRPHEPLLSPDAWYTNRGWKAGVVYPCGAVVKDGRLMVYYGGADTYVCVATAPFDRFLEDLVRGRRPALRLAAVGRWLRSRSRPRRPSLPRGRSRNAPV